MTDDFASRDDNAAPDMTDAGAAPDMTAPRIPTPAPALTDPADPTPSPGRSGRSRRARRRWAIALLVTILTLLASAAGLAILSAGAATSALVGYVPAGSVAYLEVRLDAPGDQHQNAANLLSHFPGFADQSNLGTKMDEALDQLIGDATNGSQSFTGSLKGWLGDSLAVVVTRLPDLSASTGSGSSPAAAVASVAAMPKNALLLVAVKDPAKARDWATATFGAGTGQETYAGIPLTTIVHDGQTLEYGVVSNVLLIGDPESVHDAIDTKGNATFPESASFKAAAVAVPGDRLAFGFLDLRQIVDAYEAANPNASPTALNLDQLPEWIALSVRAESDSLSAAVAFPNTNLAPVTSNHTSTIATHLPPTTVAAAEIHDLAALLGTMSATLHATSGPDASPSQLDQALQALGGIDNLVGWMGDSSVAAVRGDDPTDLSVGVVVQAKDADTAASKLVELKNLVSLVGSSAGFKVADETYDGVTITTIDAGPVAALPLPVDLSPLNLPAGTHLRISVAQKDDLVIAGLGDSFVKAVLDTEPGKSLADQDTYKQAIDKAGSSNTGQVYVDLQTVIANAVARMSAADQARYESDLKPYLDAFEALAISGSAGDPNRARAVVTVK
jgi:hypothetical protein